MACAKKVPCQGVGKELTLGKQPGRLRRKARQETAACSHDPGNALQSRGGPRIATQLPIAVSPGEPPARACWHKHLAASFFQRHKLYTRCELGSKSSSPRGVGGELLGGELGLAGEPDRNSIAARWAIATLACGAVTLSRWRPRNTGTPVAPTQRFSAASARSGRGPRLPPRPAWGRRRASVSIRPR